MLIQITNSLTLTRCPADLAAEVCGQVDLHEPQMDRKRENGPMAGGDAEAATLLQDRPGRRPDCSARLRRSTGGLRQDFQCTHPFRRSAQELPEMALTFNGSMRPYQNDAAEAILEKHFGTLAAPKAQKRDLFQDRVVTGGRNWQDMAKK